QEFNLQSQFGAEYGRNSGSVVNIITRSGTNHLHGSLFEFLRNDALDARNFFNRPPDSKSAFRNNQFGGSIGGPIIHDKTFFFGAYEGQRERVTSDFSLQVPTAAQITAPEQVVLDRGSTPSGGVTNMLGFFPASATGTLSGSVRDKNDVDSVIAKVDHRLNSSESISGRYGFARSEQVFPLGG